jgi:hypothetical protein
MAGIGKSFNKNGKLQFSLSQVETNFGLLHN